MTGTIGNQDFMNKNAAKAWSIAPLPKFLDKGLASALVQEGYYPSVEDAYLELEPGITDKVRTLCAEYLSNYQYPLCWQFAQLPRHS
jgi:hypothetical protein